MKSAKPVSEAITAPILLLVEGQDEEYLLQQMCAHWFQGRASEIDIECVGGANKFAASFKALNVRSLGPLKVIGVIADSEEDPLATAQRWNDLIAQVEPTIKRQCSVLQLPSAHTAGAFEALVLTALQEDPVVLCATNFRDCVMPHIGQRTSAQRDKIAVQAWLSASLGQAYGNVFKAQQRNPDKPLLNYDHVAFHSIRAFIESLMNEVV